jgi:ribonuclease D
VLYLHALKEKLNKMLIRENRFEIFQSCVNFLPTRVELDLQNFGNVDIFTH